MRLQAMAAAAAAHDLIFVNTKPVYFFLDSSASSFVLGTPGVDQHCLFMKVRKQNPKPQSKTKPPTSFQEIGDGIALRKRILANLELGPPLTH
jgi:hypothetical protein